LPRLGLNIDHVATLRQARRTFEPEPVAAALIAEMAGAHGITLHVREDRRHVQERDLELCTRLCRTRINLEMAATSEMTALALKYHPEVATLVPERREEVTTEGGLNLTGRVEHIAECVDALGKAGIILSAFIDPNSAQVEATSALGFDTVELHTGAYANSESGKRQLELDKLNAAAILAASLGLKVAAGHGLTYYNVKPVVGISIVEELNIGHSIMARAILVGLDRAVREMLALITTPEDAPDIAQMFRTGM
jgi:pyridoxine 5-phosphate synthase